MVIARKPQKSRKKAARDGGDVDAATVRTEPSKKHHIRAWRLFRGYATQQELCNDIARNLSKLSRAFPHLSIGKTSNGFTRATLCRIENGTLRFNEDQLDVLAYMLKTTPGDLIKTDPFNSGSIFVIYSHLTAPQRKKLDDMAAKMIEPPK